jgi:hypothetical protein
MGSSLICSSNSQSIHSYFVLPRTSHPRAKAPCPEPGTLQITSAFSCKRQGVWLVHGWEFRIHGSVGGTEKIRTRVRTSDGCPHVSFATSVALMSIARVGSTLRRVSNQCQKQHWRRRHEEYRHNPLTLSCKSSDMDLPLRLNLAR